MRNNNVKFIKNSIKLLSIVTSLFIIGFFLVAANQTSVNPMIVINNGDNEIVSSVTEDTTPPAWNPTPTNQISVYGTNFSYQVHATDDLSSNLDYWIAETIRFDINETTGLITNNTPLSLGVYSLIIHVNDSSDNMNNATITITVKTSTQIIIENLVTASTLSSILENESIEIPGYEVYILLAISGAAITLILFKKRSYIKL